MPCTRNNSAAPGQLTRQDAYRMTKAGLIRRIEAAGGKVEDKMTHRNDQGHYIGVLGIQKQNLVDQMQSLGLIGGSKSVTFHHNNQPYKTKIYDCLPKE